MDDQKELRGWGPVDDIRTLSGWGMVDDTRKLEVGVWPGG